jgi:pimeloyl-ACP methyl ester carboxylesterase
VAIQRGMAGNFPYAAVGSGRPVVICSGLWPTTGVESNSLVEGALGPVRDLGAGRRLIVLNRRARLPAGMSISALAAEYAETIREHFGGRVDVVGSSTGGSIAQQLAADHPDTVGRLVLLSTACRLGRVGRESQSRVAAALRAGHTRAALAHIAGELAPRGLRVAVRAAALIAAPHIVPDAQSRADLATTLEAEDGFDLAACAKPITARTLIVVGGRDRFYSRELFEETAKLIQNSTLAVFPRRGHITVTTDSRARVAITKFLGSTEEKAVHGI